MRRVRLPFSAKTTADGVATANARLTGITKTLPCQNYSTTCTGELVNPEGDASLSARIHTPAWLLLQVIVADHQGPIDISGETPPAAVTANTHISLAGVQ